jgi:hypothetical protein
LAEDLTKMASKKSGSEVGMAQVKLPAHRPRLHG